jgi:pimeloyl-ACP methyl ester carboxylesterase
MPKATVNGAGISYRRIGAGPDVVLLHGLAASMAFWHPELLRGLSESYRLTLYDLRGHGYSDMPPAGYTTADMAADLLGLLDHLAIPAAHLVGHSFGGAVALHLAALRPARVAGLVLADAAVNAFQPPTRVRDLPRYRAWQGQYREAGIDLASDQLLDLSLLERLADPALEEARQRMAESRYFVPFSGRNGGRRAAARLRELLATTTARADVTAAGLDTACLRRVELPALLVYGELSHCLPTLRGLQESLPRSTTVLSPGVGHFHPAVRPGFLLAQLQAFLVRPHSAAADAARRPVVAPAPAGAGPAPDTTPYEIQTRSGRDA